MPKAGSRYRTSEVCITCRETKPCSYHGIRRGFVCADCWNWSDVPENIKRDVGLRNQETAKRVGRKHFKRHADQPRPHKNLTVRPVRYKYTAGNPPPPHPDAL